MSNNIMESGVRSQESGVRSQESGVRPVVSFCVPVYNNAEAAVKVISNILVSDDPRLEVVACDNASTDNTQEALSQIHDPRFRYFRNEKNLGPQLNWFRVLGLGQGDWLYLVMGRDRINGEHISELISALGWAEDNGITLLRDGYERSSKTRVYTGIQAMAKFIEYDHPTGTIFDAEVFRKIPDRETYARISDVYPENYLRRDMLLKGKGASITTGCYHNPDVVIDLAKIKSNAEKTGGDIFNSFYAPRRRTTQFFELVDMVEKGTSGVFSQKELDWYFGQKFQTLLLVVSTGWRERCRNRVILAHYGYEVRHVSIREMLGHLRSSWRMTAEHLKQQGIYSRSKQRIMRMCMAKAVCRVFLGSVGIWQVLRFVKGLIVRR